jgi:hypothetical protein
MKSKSYYIVEGFDEYISVHTLQQACSWCLADTDEKSCWLVGPGEQFNMAYCNQGWLHC